ncbi:hypothetical protein GCM10022222_55750 [Amycolatopsis ultiminotia]|uniref:Uncharacterized protein n=1 Tax=Amycolatopsis ultiminotia TaxID=543629 RepID=A0ABP6XD58_9PSEU
MGAVGRIALTADWHLRPRRRPYAPNEWNVVRRSAEHPRNRAGRKSTVDVRNQESPQWTKDAGESPLWKPARRGGSSGQASSGTGVVVEF